MFLVHNRDNRCQFRINCYPNNHVFKLQEKTRVLRGDRHAQGEDSSSCCKATTIALPISIMSRGLQLNLRRIVGKKNIILHAVQLLLENKCIFHKSNLQDTEWFVLAPSWQLVVVLNIVCVVKAFKLKARFSLFFFCPCGQTVLYFSAVKCPKRVFSKTD